MGLLRAPQLVTLLAFLFTICPFTGGEHRQATRLPSPRAALGIFETARSETDVLRVLRVAGYPQATATLHHQPGQLPQPQLPPQQDAPSRIVGHSCHNASVQTATQYVDGGVVRTLGQKALAASRSFLEQQETRQTASTFKNLASAAKNADRTADLVCECEPYECHCQKQCFCRMTEDPFKGLHYPPEANCPVCPVCSDMKTPGAKSDSDVFPVPPPKQDYKCSCSFEGIGGAGLSNGGFMECDCKVADCTCAKKCACRKRPANAQSAPPPPSAGNGGGGNNRGGPKKPKAAEPKKVSVYDAAVCCKFTDPKGRGPGDHFVWLTNPKDITACHVGSYGEGSSPMTPGLLNDAGEDLSTPSGCRRASGEERLPTGKVDKAGGNKAMARTLEAMCCICEDSKSSLGAQYVWLTEMDDMVLCAAGRYRGRSLPAQGSNPVGEPYTKKDACRDVLVDAPILRPDLNQALRAGGRL